MQEDYMEQLIQTLKAMPKEQRDLTAMLLLGVLNGMEIGDMMHDAKKSA